MKFISFFLCAFMVIMTISCQSQKSPQTLSAVDFNKKISATPDAIILDVRTEGEYAEGSIEHSVNINFNGSDFEKTINGMDHDKTYFVYCRSGGRSSSAANFMRSNGFKNVYDLKGGLLAWEKNNFKVSQSQVAPRLDMISMEQYQKIISSDDIVLIDFYAPWCGPCMKMAPMLDKLTKEYEGKAKIIRINVDENKSLAQNLRIDEIPFFKLYRSGKEMGNYIGQLDRPTLIKMLEKQ